MITTELPENRDIEAQFAAMEAVGGLFDDDMTDLSLTVNEGIHIYIRNKYGSAG